MSYEGTCDSSYGIFFVCNILWFLCIYLFFYSHFIPKHIFNYLMGKKYPLWGTLLLEFAGNGVIIFKSQFSQILYYETTYYNSRNSLESSKIRLS